jgi:hypothetical protein
LKEAAIAEINEALSSNPDFERCTSDGNPDPSGDHWKIARAGEREIFQMTTLCDFADHPAK